jgi:hypothetical protein
MPRYPKPNVNTPTASDIKKLFTLAPPNPSLDVESRN